MTEVRLLAASHSTTGVPPVPWTPMKGDRVEHVRNGVTVSGRIFYADQLQVLVKWDNGSSSSLRVDKGELRSVRVTRTDSGSP